MWLFAIFSERITVLIKWWAGASGETKNNPPNSVNNFLFFFVIYFLIEGKNYLLDLNTYWVHFIKF